MEFEQMTAYDQKAWREATSVLDHTGRTKLLPEEFRRRISSVGALAFSKAGEIPGADTVQDIVAKAFEGGLALTFQPALRSAGPASTIAKYARTHPGLTTLEDVRGLPLESRDKVLPPKFAYTAASAIQGGATATAVTGLEVATTVSAGTTAGVAVGAVAADAVASMAMMGRTVGVVASRYGYDTRNPEEELFAMGALSLGLAGSMGAKTQALASLSRITQQMMRRATWNELHQHVLVRVIEQAYLRLGLRLTQRKLAQVIPVAGIAINGALSAQMTEATFRRARAVYRLRALSDLYGIDPEAWNTADYIAGDSSSTDEEVVDVAQMLEAELTLLDEE